MIFKSEVFLPTSAIAADDLKCMFNIKPDGIHLKAKVLSCVIQQSGVFTLCIPWTRTHNRAILLFIAIVLLSQQVLFIQTARCSEFDFLIT